MEDERKDEEDEDREEEEGNESGLRHRVAHRGAEERAAARRCDQGGQDSAEEGALVAFLSLQAATRAGEEEPHLEDARHDGVGGLAAAGSGWKTL